MRWTRIFTVMALLKVGLATAISQDFSFQETDLIDINIGDVGTSSVDAQKPNFLFLIVDDLNTDLGAYGHEHAQTPHIDNLFQRGVRFDNAHVGFAACAPSRAAMIAGRRNDGIKVWTFQPVFRLFNPKLVTMTGLLQNHGYTTHAVGKVLDNRVFKTTQVARIGADTCHSTSKFAECSWDSYVTPEDITSSSSQLCGKRIRNFPLKPGRQWRDASLLWASPTNDTSLFRDDCITTVGLNKLKALSQTPHIPFFLSIGWILPHMPWVAPKSYFDKYEHLTGPDIRPKEAIGPRVARFWKQHSGQRRKNLEMFDYRNHAKFSFRRKNIGYLASTSFIDDQVARVMHYFDTSMPSAVRKNTVIVFWSDHGFHLGEHGLWGKYTTFDRATRVPFGIVPSRNMLEESPELQQSVGGVVKAPVESVDIYPTLAELCGAGLVPSQEYSGTSLVPLLKNTSHYIRSAAISQGFKGAETDAKLMAYAIRTTRYRLIVYAERFDRHKNRPALPYQKRRIRHKLSELYDYERDGPIENVNRIRDPAYKHIKQRLHQIWFSNVDRDWLVLIDKKPFDLHGEHKPVGVS